MSPLTPPKGRLSRPSLWLVTFGDLLTLMLCFFLATISLRPLSSTSTSALTTQNNKVSTAKLNSLVQLKGAGTRLAAKEEELSAPRPAEIRKQVVLSEGSFLRARAELSRSAQSQLNNAVTTDGYEVRSVAIQVCTDKKGYVAEKTASLSVERALRVRGQLIDRGISPEALRVRALADSCTGLPQDVTHEGRIGVVDFILGRHG
jgi:flagellar motor protein MotB